MVTRAVGALGRACRGGDRLERQGTVVGDGLGRGADPPQEEAGSAWGLHDCTPHTPSQHPLAAGIRAQAQGFQMRSFWDYPGERWRWKC